MAGAGLVRYESGTPRGGEVLGRMPGQPPPAAVTTETVGVWPGPWGLRAVLKCDGVGAGGYPLWGSCFHSPKPLILSVQTPVQMPPSPTYGQGLVCTRRVTAHKHERSGVPGGDILAKNEGSERPDDLAIPTRLKVTLRRPAPGSVCPSATSLHSVAVS